MTCPTCTGIMRPDHDRWPEFVDRLASDLAGPHVFATGDVNAIVQAAVQACQHGTYNASRAILSTMGLDVEESLEFFDVHGVCCSCDCEVLCKLETEYREGGPCACDQDED